MAGSRGRIRVNPSRSSSRTMKTLLMTFEEKRAPSSADSPSADIPSAQCGVSLFPTAGQMQESTLSILKEEKKKVVREKIIIQEVTRFQRAVPLSCLIISLTASCKERQPGPIFTAGELKHLVSHDCVSEMFFQLTVSPSPVEKKQNKNK